tara:strand:- start:50 stop:1132 length:1083 start_codon:yes stop_codon:yes gene_type:complete
LYIHIKKTIIRVYEITRVVLVTLVAELRHQFTRYRRGPNQRVWDIDVVYLWSDPSDLEWSKKRLKVLSSEGRDDFCCIDDQTISPPVTLDELRYSLRSIDSFLEGVRYVHIVVDGQVPEWLNLDHPQLRVIEAKDIITDKNHYPNYNTQAIESYFFNIPDLSERFIYFNDDFFLSRKTGVDEFYTLDGLIRVRLGRALSPRGMPVSEEEGDSAGHKNANKILDDQFGKRARLTVMHRPYAHHKALLKAAEEDFPEAFEETRSSRFRSTKMVAIHSFLLPYAASYQKKADLVPPRLLEKDMFKWGQCSNSNHKVTQRVRSLRGKGFCIQEERGIQIPESEVSRFHEFMSDLFPDPSSFEKN